ncbi:hypothetical protein ACPOL_4798 [Acidisarcina polymorpha]|uniref:Uncharacterized protein n=1 Tax=Acidisarcina polymorpha TaxID=2211140 RepID=A0A2Z5G5P1_9BACT|nr:hypothetical protein ACPOL_4798 [Acidisarcina polymorpha]
MLRTVDSPGGLDPAIFEPVIELIAADYPNALRQLAPSFWEKVVRFPRI